MKLSKLLRGLVESGGIDEELTRRYYQAFAEILRPYARERVAREIASDLADFFARDNPGFERERFLRSAGMALRPGVTPEPVEEPLPVSEQTEKQIDAAQEALDALYAALNLEGVAKAGEMYVPARRGIDVDYHFRKIRKAIDVLEKEFGLQPS